MSVGHLGWLSDTAGHIVLQGGFHHVCPWHPSICGNPPCVVFFQGVIADLKLQGDPRAAERQCEEEEDDTEEVSADSPTGAGWGAAALCSWLTLCPFSPGKCRSLVILAAGQKVDTNPRGKTG